MRIAIALGAYASLRSGEVRALQARHVDLKERGILVLEAFSDDEIGDPKSRQRPVPIAPPLIPILEEALRGKNPDDFLVVNRSRRTPSRQAVLTRLNALEKRPGLPNWTFHSLRHYFCSRYSLVEQRSRRFASLPAMQTCQARIATSTRWRSRSGQR